MSGEVVWENIQGYWNKFRRVIWNKIPREQLNPGDHIYTWKRGANSKAHHGIYFDDENVIHFTQGGSSNHRICQNCGNQPGIRGVVSSCVDCFLSDGGGGEDLYVFEYGVSRDLFIVKPGWNTCTTTRADPNNENVRGRADFLLRNGFVGYHHYIRNSYDFAIYCKTGLLVYTSMNMGRNEPAASILTVTVVVFFVLLQRMPANFTALTASGLGIYSTCRLALDIGAHPNAIEVEAKAQSFAQVERLAFDRLGSRNTVDFLFKLALLAVKYALISLAFSMWSTTRPLVWALAGFKFLYWAVFNRTFEIGLVLSNKIERWELQPGDHIYTWRGYFYTHHGIYVGKIKRKMMVIDLIRGAAPIVPSSSSTSHRSNNNVGDQMRGDRVEICSIDNFLKRGQLYRYDYGVDLDFFIAKSRGGTGTLAYSDPEEEVLHRAYFLLENGFGAYNLFHNNCEDFAIYCKTGLLVPRIITLGRSGQTTSYAALFCAVCSFPYSLLLTSIGDFVGVLAVGYVLYSIWRLFSDTGFRADARIVGVHEVAAFDRFIAFMSRQLSFTLVPKFICYPILICTLFPGRTWTVPDKKWAIRSENCLLDWIITVAYMWAASF